MSDSIWDAGLDIALFLTLTAATFIVSFCLAW